MKHYKFNISFASGDIALLRQALKAAAPRISDIRMSQILNLLGEKDSSIGAVRMTPLQFARFNAYCASNRFLPGPPTIFPYDVHEVEPSPIGLAVNIANIREPDPVEAQGTKPDSGLSNTAIRQVRELLDAEMEKAVDAALRKRRVSNAPVVKVATTVFYDRYGTMRSVCNEDFDLLLGHWMKHGNAKSGKIPCEVNFTDRNRAWRCLCNEDFQILAKDGTRSLLGIPAQACAPTLPVDPPPYVPPSERSPRMR